MKKKLINEIDNMNSFERRLYENKNSSIGDHKIQHNPLAVYEE